MHELDRGFVELFDDTDTGNNSGGHGLDVVPEPEEPDDDTNVHPAIGRNPERHRAEPDDGDAGTYSGRGGEVDPEVAPSAMPVAEVGEASSDTGRRQALESIFGGLDDEGGHDTPPKEAADIGHQDEGGPEQTDARLHSGDTSQDEVVVYTRETVRPSDHAAPTQKDDHEKTDTEQAAGYPAPDSGWRREDADEPPPRTTPPIVRETARWPSMEPRVDGTEADLRNDALSAGSGGDPTADVFHVPVEQSGTTMETGSDTGERKRSRRDGPRDGETKPDDREPDPWLKPRDGSSDGRRNDGYRVPERTPTRRDDYPGDQRGERVADAGQTGPESGRDDHNVSRPPADTSNPSTALDVTQRQFPSYWDSDTHHRAPATSNVQDSSTRRYVVAGSSDTGEQGAVKETSAKQTIGDAVTRYLRNVLDGKFTEMHEGSVPKWHKEYRRDHKGKSPFGVAIGAYLKRREEITAGAPSILNWDTRRQRIDLNKKNRRTDRQIDRQKRKTSRKKEKFNKKHGL